MRISDWSSDVCSSDLIGPFLQYKPSSRMNSYLVWGNQRDGPRPRPQFPRDLAAADGGRQRLAEPLLDDRTPRHQAELPPRLQHRVASAGQLHAAAVDAGGRSEEHTSELQSLMRISYAVFC